MKKVLVGSVLCVLAVLACIACQEKTKEEVPEAEPKIIIYQMLVRIFGNTNTTNVYNGTREQNGCGRMSDITPEALQSIRRLGCNYVWYTGIIQQATKTDWSAYGLPKQNPAVVKGNAGSPYAICDYYAVSADLADSVPLRNQEFRALVERTHEADLKVIIDFIPNHVACEYHSVTCPPEVVDLGTHDDTNQAFFIHNNFYYFPDQTLVWQEVHSELDKDVKSPISKNANVYRENPAKVTGNNVFSSPVPSVDDWYETVKLNYGVRFLPDGQQEKAWLNADGSVRFVPSTWTQMTAILLYWCEMGVDGFRCDVSEMVPVEFWQYCIPRVKEQYPNTLFIAEIYNPKAYLSYIENGHFDYLYNKVEFYDSIRAVVEGRRDVHAIQHYTETGTYRNTLVRSHMLNFMENHDEQRIASKFFAKTPEAGIPALYVSLLINRNPYMIYFGQELGESAMDAEGYSSADGRTTIFDYWGLECMKAWHQVDWDESQLPYRYNHIRERYEEALKLAQLPAVKSGALIDITTPSMADNNIFAFKRKLGSQVLIVIANFGDSPYFFQRNGTSHQVNAKDVLTLQEEELK